MWHHACDGLKVKIAIVSHSYLTRENQKNLSAIGKQAELLVVSPRSVDSALFSYDFRMQAERIKGDSWTMLLCRRVKLCHGQWLLASSNLGFDRFKPDIVHVEYDTWTPMFWQALAVTKRYVRSAAVICTVKQNTYTTYTPLLQVLKGWIGNILARHVTCFMAVNEGVSRIYQERFGVGEDRIVNVTQLGVDVEHFRPATEEGKQHLRDGLALPSSVTLVGYAGRFDAEKGVGDLIEAVSLARKVSQEDIHLALIGAGSMADDIKKARLSQGWLHALPVVPHAQMPEFLCCLDVFAMPSRITDDHVEHDAHALLEAMACGLPCIGTTSGVIPEILQGFGLVVDAGNPSKMAGAILDALDSRMVEGFRGSGRRRISEEFSIEAVSAKKLKAYVQTS